MLDPSVTHLEFIYSEPEFDSESFDLPSDDQILKLSVPTIRLVCETDGIKLKLRAPDPELQKRWITSLEVRLLPSSLWSGMKKEFKLFIAACVKCQRIKQPRAYLRAPLQTMVYTNFNDMFLLLHN